MSGHTARVHRSRRFQWTALISVALAAGGLGAAFGLLRAPWAPRGEVRAAVPPVPVVIHTIGEIFDEGVPGGILDTILHRSYDDFQPVLGPEQIEPGGASVRDIGIRGAKFRGYCNKYEFPSSPYLCDCPDPQNPPNLCDDPLADPIEKESRYTIEIFLPAEMDTMISDPATAHVLIINSSAPDEGGEPSEGYESKRVLAATLADQGVPAVIWWQRDDLPYPPGGTPVDRLSHLFGFPGDGAIQKAGQHWMMLRDPDNLTVQDLRFDYRFAYAQFYMYAATFFQVYLVHDKYPGQPEAAEWVSALRTTFAGGSKRGGGVIDAAGLAVGAGMVAGAVDPRAEAIYVAGYQGFSDLEDCGFHRYETDWRLCSSCQPTCDPCASLEGTIEHPWKDFAYWVWQYRDHHPSWMDAYIPTRSMYRYRPLLIMDVVGTHDWINPLGAHTELWNRFDASQAPAGPVSGLVPGAPPQVSLSKSVIRDKLANFRIIRRINKNHGVEYIVGNERGIDWGAGHVLLLHAMRSLRNEEPLARMILRNIDTNGPEWYVDVNAGHFREGHVPSQDEEYTVHLAFSDDRDFRRCTPPIESHNPNLCLDADWDDNKEEEDKFIAVTPTRVERYAKKRRIYFVPPPEFDTFSTPPLVALTVEGRFLGNDPGSILDDLTLFTEIEFLNLDLYPPFDCGG